MLSAMKRSHISIAVELVSSAVPQVVIRGSHNAAAAPRVFVRIARDHGNGSAKLQRNGAREKALTIADEWQHKGVAELLMAQLIEYAKGHGVESCIRWNSPRIMRCSNWPKR